MRFSATLLLLLCLIPANAGHSYFFRINFSDKNGCGYSLSKPHEFLSQRAIERREKNNIQLTESDLPVTNDYCKRVVEMGCREVCRLKWTNSMVIECCDSSTVDAINSLPFVTKSQFLYSSKFDFKSKAGDDNFFNIGNHKTIFYGAANATQQILNCEPLHKKGYWGNGVFMAVLDAGFGGADTLNQWFDFDRITYSTDLVNPKGNIFIERQHGCAVLSVMFANNPYNFVGVSPQCNYALIRSEDFNREAPYEEDLWVRGAEIADSLGVDILVSSLGYLNFDGIDNNSSKGISTMGAEIASEKGMIIVNSCGNRGNSGTITRPADAKGVIAVGATTDKGDVAGFSSKGYICNSIVKPDVVSLGEAVAVIKSDGEISAAYGTSYAAPAIAGGIALLIEALPQLNYQDIILLLKKSGNNSKHPDEYQGYGIPDIYKAYKKGIR